MKTFLPEAGFAIVFCGRFLSDRHHGAKVLATRQWKKGQLVHCLVGFAAEVSPAEQQTLIQQGPSELCCNSPRDICKGMLCLCFRIVCFGSLCCLMVITALSQALTTLALRSPQCGKPKCCGLGRHLTSITVCVRLGFGHLCALALGIF